MDEYKMLEDVKVSIRVAKLETKTKVLMPLVVLMVIALVLMAVLLTVQTIARNEMPAQIAQLQSEISNLEDVDARLARVENRVSTAEKAADSAIEAVGTLNKKVTANEKSFDEFKERVEIYVDTIVEYTNASQELFDSHSNLIHLILQYLNLE